LDDQGGSKTGGLADGKALAARRLIALAACWVPDLSDSSLTTHTENQSGGLVLTSKLR